MKTLVVPHSAIEACPKTILRPQHYEQLPDGSVKCLCQRRPMDKISFEEALSHLTFSMGHVMGTAMRLRDSGGEVRISINQHLANLEGMLKDPEVDETMREVLITTQASAEWIRDELNRLALAGPDAG